MFKHIIVVMLMVLSTAPCFGAIQGHNIHARPTGDWGKNGGAKDTSTLWMRAAEDMILSQSGLGLGKIWYVNSNVSSAGNGESWTGAVATLDEIVALIDTDRNSVVRMDIIDMAEGHNEAFTAGDDADIDIDNVIVRGHGTGSGRPTFDYDDTDGLFVVGGDNVTLYNLIFRASSASVVNAVDIEAGSDYTTIIECIFDNETDVSDQFIDAVNLGDGCVGTRIENNLFDSGLQAIAASAIYLDFDTVDVVILNNTIRGDYSTANITGDTTLSTNLLIRGNLLVNGASGNINTQPAIDLLTGTTGEVIGNMIVCNVGTVAAAMETVDTMMIFGNSYNEDAGATAADKPWNAGGVGGTLVSVSTSGDD